MGLTPADSCCLRPAATQTSHLRHRQRSGILAAVQRARCAGSTQGRPVVVQGQDSADVRSVSALRAEASELHGGAVPRSKVPASLCSFRNLPGSDHFTFWAWGALPELRTSRSGFLDPRLRTYFFFLSTFWACRAAQTHLQLASCRLWRPAIVRNQPYASRAALLLRGDACASVFRA